MPKILRDTPIEDVPEFSVAFMHSMTPLPFDRGLQWWIGCPWTHVAMRVGIGEQRLVFHSNPRWPARVFPVSGPQFHTLEYYERVVIPLWKRWVWGRYGIGHIWVPPPREPTSEQANAMRTKASVMADDARKGRVKYEMVLNYFFGRANRIHCSEAVGAVQEAGGFGISLRHRNTPCHCWRAYQ